MPSPRYDLQWDDDTEATSKPLKCTAPSRTAERPSLEQRTETAEQLPQTLEVEDLTSSMCSSGALTSCGKGKVNGIVNAFECAVSSTTLFFVGKGSFIHVSAQNVDVVRGG